MLTHTPGSAFAAGAGQPQAAKKAQGGGDDPEHQTDSEKGRRSGTLGRHTDAEAEWHGEALSILSQGRAMLHLRFQYKKCSC